MPTANESGKSPERATEAFPSRALLGGAGALLVLGWFLILRWNNFHLTAPVVFVCLGYLAGVSAVYTLFRSGAAAASGGEADGDEGGWGRPVGARSELEREKKVLLKAIKEAEFDLQMGKLSKLDAEAMIGAFRAQAIAVIREIDRKGEGEASVREQIEREVRARLAVAKAKKPAEADRRAAGKKGKQPPDPAAQAHQAEAAAAKAEGAAAKAEGAATKGDEAVARAEEAVAKAEAAAVKAAEAEDAAAEAEDAVKTDSPDAAAAKEATP